MNHFYHFYNSLPFDQSYNIEAYFSKNFFLFLAIHTISFFYQVNLFKDGHYKKVLNNFLVSDDSGLAVCWLLLSSHFGIS